MSEKYPICVHISALVLFFVIQTVESFEVIPIWLNHMIPVVHPHLKAVLERRFWIGLQLAHRITLNRFDVVEPLSFERHFQCWEHPKVGESYVWTVRRLAKPCSLVFRLKLFVSFQSSPYNSCRDWSKTNAMNGKSTLNINTRCAQPKASGR